MFNFSAILIGLASFFMSLLGGYSAIRFQAYIKYLVAYCGGTLVAAALLNLIPESFELLENVEVTNILAIVLGSFIVFLLVDKLLLLHGHTHSDEDSHEHHDERRGIIPALGLIVHSFLDGLSIGAAFLISFQTGILISSVILLHNFADGFNTVTIALRNNKNTKVLYAFMTASALAPITGVLISQFIHPSNTALGYILATYAGFFLYLGATDLLPEAHRERSSIRLVTLTVIGAATVAAFRLLLEH